MQFDLENLHWREFEQLVTFYLKDIVGEGVYAFDGSPDQGRDAIFQGTANSYPSRSKPYLGDWIFQVKHRVTRSRTSKQVETELKAKLKDELEKVFKKYNFKCDNYIYITNLEVSNDFRDECTTIFEKYCSVNNFSGKNFGVIKYDDLEIYITNNPTVRYRFPSLLKFTDLDQIFRKKEEIKNKGYLKSARASINTFVSTHHYAEAITRIREDNLLMLVGNPKSGKTQIVEAIALCFSEEGQYRPYFIHNTDEFFQISSNLHDSEHALFICDDIFGKHELDETKFQDWMDYFESVLGLIDTNHKFLFTTREYIFREFKRRSGLERILPRTQDRTRYVIEISELTENEREEILDKHVNLSDLPETVINLTLGAKAEILSCKDFSPEVIRSLVALLRQTPIDEVSDHVTAHIRNPNKYLYDFFENINQEKRMLLMALAVALSSDSSEVERSLLQLCSETQTVLSVTFQTFVEELEGSILKRIEFIDSSEVDYYHPTMYDVIIGIFKDDRRYRELMLNNLNLELFSLLTYRPSTSKERDETNKVHIKPDEIENVALGVERFLNRTSSIRDVMQIIQYSNRLNNEVVYNPSYLAGTNKLRILVRSEISKYRFYEAHMHEPIEYWVDLFDKWNLLLLKSTTSIEYAADIERRYRNFDLYDYWRLVFLLESVQTGFIQECIDAQQVNIFTNLLANRVHGLTLRLNIRQVTDENGIPITRPFTDEGWLPLFREVDDLITKMKRSPSGKRTYEHNLRDDWELISRYGDFPKNRHIGMITAGHWRRNFRRLRNYRSLREGEL